MLENVTPKFSKKPIKVIGCGLAGAEIAFILANNGFDVHIFDNKENRPSYGFDYYDKYQNFMTENMKYELECLNSPLISLAKKFGNDKFGFEYDHNFMTKVRRELEANVRIKIFDANIDQLNETETNVIATGHGTSVKLLEELKKIIGRLHLCYFQPEEIVIDAQSVDLKQLNFVNESECFANLTVDEYISLNKKIKSVDENYEKSKINEDEKQITIESMVALGELSLRNSILRPHLAEKEKPYASLKMIYKPLQNVLILPNFFTAFDELEQEEILHLFSDLKHCKILRYCKVRRTTFLLSPTCLKEDMQIANNVFVCGGFAGTAGSFESLLTANYCAYSIINQLKNRVGVEILREKTCISKILGNLLEKSVINYRLFNLKYDIINEEDLNKFKKEVEVQKILSKTQIEKFKEKFYGKYF